MLVIAPEEKDDMAVSDNRDENALHSDGTSRPLGRRATSKRQNKAIRFKRNTTPNPCVERYQLKLIDRETVVPTVICAEGCKEIKRVYFFEDRDDPLTFAVDYVNGLPKEHGGEGYPFFLFAPSPDRAFSFVSFIL